MKVNSGKIEAVVRRITIDEKLSDDLIRALVSPLAKGAEEFGDRTENWGEEEEILIRPEDYLSKLDIPSSKAKDLPWPDFREGQVFLSGQFRAVDEKEKPERFAVSPGQKEFLRIDGNIKAEVKRLYFEALKGKRRE
jgi:hypothetical protein